MQPDTSTDRETFITHDVDAYEDRAEHLMDELFEDVESMLSLSTMQRPGSERPTRKLPSPAASSSLARVEPKIIERTDTVTLTKLDLPAVPLPPLSRQDLLWLEPHVPQAPPPATPELHVVREVVPPAGGLRWVEGVLLLAACTSVAIAALGWIANRRWFEEKLATLSGTTAISPALTPDRLQFVEEIRKSLASINTNAPLPAVGSAVGTVPTAVTALPPATAPLNAGQGANVQPVYIPLYQPPATPAPLPAPAAIAPTPAVSSPPAAPMVAVATPAPPAASIALVGILELSDRASAMFDVSGNMQSVPVGTLVGETGWKLLKVGKQDATLQRGSEVKTVYIGQRF